METEIITCLTSKMLVSASPVNLDAFHKLVQTILFPDLYSMPKPDHFFYTTESFSKIQCLCWELDNLDLIVIFRNGPNEKDYIFGTRISRRNVFVC